MRNLIWVELTEIPFSLSQSGNPPDNKGVSNVSGTFLTTDPILVSDLAALVRSNAAGAIVTFSGDVRNNDHGREVLSLSYEAHPSAQALLEKVANQVAADYDVVSVAVAHRHGEIAIGEAALVVAVSAQHRKAAFDACVALVDEVKSQIPIWKHQVFADGTDEWVNCA
jgi:molybdopterin synthase catalytic subunit